MKTSFVLKGLQAEGINFKKDLDNLYTVKIGYILYSIQNKGGNAELKKIVLDNGVTKSQEKISSRKALITDIQAEQAALNAETQNDTVTVTQEVIEEIVVNVVPENYPGDPKSARGYCWSDYETKAPGLDIKKEDWEQEVLRLISINNAKTAYVNCMWPGGYTGEYPRKKEVEQPVIVTGTEKETHGIGWCNRCDSHCFGDCQAN